MRENSLPTTVLDFYTADLNVDAETGAISYDTPEVLGGSAQVAMAFTKNPQKIYESGITARNKTYVSDATVTVDSHTVSLKDKMSLYYSVDEDASGGYAVGADANTPKRKAVGWPVALDNDEYLCTWFYDASAAPADETYQTSNEQGPQLTPNSIAFSCVRRPTDRLLFYTKKVTGMAAMLAFMGQVQEPAVETGG